MIDRSLIERIIAGLLDDRAGVRYSVVAQVIDSVPSWWVAALPLGRDND